MKGDPGAQYVVLPADIRLAGNELARLPSLGNPGPVQGSDGPGNTELARIWQPGEHVGSPERFRQELHRFED